jgi:transposase-like protein
MTEKTSNRFSPEARRRAVRMVLDHGGDHASQGGFKWSSQRLGREDCDGGSAAL